VGWTGKTDEGPRYGEMTDNFSPVD
jgi:hypothetical protein